MALTALPVAPDHFEWLAILAIDQEGSLEVLRGEVVNPYPSLTPLCPQAHLFEREMAEQWKLSPEGHPWLKPVRYHAAWVGGSEAENSPATPPPQPAVTRFFQVEGKEVHEVAVGPVHAGIIEPGHFRFQCHGERVLYLEIALGFQHRGIDRAFFRLPHRRQTYVETLAGDSSIGHAWAYAQAIEGLALKNPAIPMSAHILRGIALELERLANHTGDLGALANDVGFLPTASYCGRIRGDFLNMTALICGNRFGRGLIGPGGVSWSLDESRKSQLLRVLDAAEADVSSAVNLLWDTPSVMARFEDTGTISADLCRDLGLVGPPVRAVGLDRDVRQDFPSGIYRFSHIPVATASGGDVFARAFVRWIEIQRSIDFIRQQIPLLKAETGAGAPPLLKPNAFTVSLIEGWRGEICHLAHTDAQGHLDFYKVIDPSFHNWTGLAIALRNQQISDFPLCNKSFNLSYCGHDL
jgi:Ni,Fe-hydrogenase III large subunit